jgi:S-formylglutathione hydrolase FrmB
VCQRARRWDRVVWAAAILLAALPAGRASAGWFGKLRLELINRNLHGRLVDFTHHHGADRRIWSQELCQKRDLYVYLPPGFDPQKRYPLVVWLHGYMEDEAAFPYRVLPRFDDAIASGRMPPAIIAAPGGSIGRPLQGSLFLNINQGNFEDYVVHDVYPFLEVNFPLRPEREARAIVGLSGGGWAAYCIALRHPHLFGSVAGILPTLNPRWLDCHGRYRSNFDPCCWGWRNELEKNELIGLYYGLPLTLKRMFKPYFGWGPEGLARLSANNPIEMLDRFDVQPGDLAMWVGYIRRDQLNADAQIESFIYRAGQRGLCMSVDYRPRGGGHNAAAGLRFLPEVAEWLAKVIPNP